MLHQDYSYRFVGCRTMFFDVYTPRFGGIIRVGPSSELGMDVVPRLRMRGAMPPPAPCTVLMCKGTSSPVPLSHGFPKNRWRFFFFF